MFLHADSKDSDQTGRWFCHVAAHMFDIASVGIRQSREQITKTLIRQRG